MQKNVFIPMQCLPTYSPQGVCEPHPDLFSGILFLAFCRCLRRQCII
ncbi:hypothetical protein SUBVAR_05569 [Subdoligranulum variabile DSM 15176]|uniref:Uncharacterized protein n=1 Tax=Subdoligranulum variabile DSM 15176 TaxID=411471 RepID=D1PMK8_9FIRM|nr:hypothetical protein SUBVAR_05569 [Subdoligranulum variabile DSM 15176]